MPIPNIIPERIPELSEWVSARCAKRAFQRISTSTPFRNPDGSRKHVQPREKAYPEYERSIAWEKANLGRLLRA